MTALIGLSVVGSRPVPFWKDFRGNVFLFCLACGGACRLSYRVKGMLALNLQVGERGVGLAFGWVLLFPGTPLPTFERVSVFAERESAIPDHHEHIRCCCCYCCWLAPNAEGAYQPPSVSAYWCAPSSSRPTLNFCPHSLPKTYLGCHLLIKHTGPGASEPRLHDRSDRNRGGDVRSLHGGTGLDERVPSAGAQRSERSPQGQKPVTSRVFV